MKQVFGLSYDEYLLKQSRSFIAFTLPNGQVPMQVICRINIDEESANALMVEAEKLGPPDAFGGYYTPDRFKTPPIKHDVLYIAEKWQKLDQKGKIAIAYHEACHCYRECKQFQDYSENSAQVAQGRIVRKHTQYHDDDRGGHDVQWFALLAGATRNLQALHPGLFANARDIVETALTGDWDGEPIEGVDWGSLESIK